MLTVYQPAVEISIGDIFKTTQYLLGNRYTVIFYEICRLSWYIGFLKDIELSYRYRRRHRAYLFRHGEKIFAQSQVGSKLKFSLNLHTNFGSNYVNSLNFENKNDKLDLISRDERPWSYDMTSKKCNENEFCKVKCILHTQKRYQP